MTIALAGVLAGVVHVLSGPDHLAAIAPYAVTEEARSWRTGVRWGLGHCAGVLGVALLVLLSRHTLPIDKLSAYGELCVGFVLVGIGLWGARAALQHPDRGGVPAHGHRHVQRHAAVAVGTLHGLAGSAHLLGILPALALPSDGAAGVYLLCFGIGSVAAMGAFASLIGWVAARPGAKKAAMQRALLVACSVSAVLVGVGWVLESLPAAVAAWLLHVGDVA